MARKKARRKQEAVHEFLAIGVDTYEVSASVSVNRDVYAPQYAFNLELDDPLYPVNLALEICGTGLCKTDREGHAFEIRLYGTDAPSQRLDLTLKDVQERGEFGTRKFRTYRKKEIPVFRPVKGMALLEKVRGEDRWSTWIACATRFIHGAILVLKEERTRFVSIHAVREGQTRWIRNISVQTRNPEEE